MNRDNVLLAKFVNANSVSVLMCHKAVNQSINSHVICYFIQFCTTCPFICVLGMTLNCIHIFIVTGSFLYWSIMRPASQRFFIHSCICLRILIISYFATFLDTNSLYVLMCCKAVNQSIVHSFSNHLHYGYTRCVFALDFANSNHFTYLRTYVFSGTFQP